MPAASGASKAGKVFVIMFAFVTSVLARVSWEWIEAGPCKVFVSPAVLKCKDLSTDPDGCTRAPESTMPKTPRSASSQPGSAARAALPAEVVRVLLIDDDTKLCRLIRDYLAPLGYAVDAVHHGADGLARVQSGSYRAVILDVMLPGMDGFAVLKGIRQHSNVPVLMLTGRGEEADRVMGLELGADDYLPKTFSTRELLARLRAVTRRAERTATSEAEEETLSNGGLSLSPGARTALLEGEPLRLTALEYDLLLCLLRSAGRALNREQILDAVAGRNYEVFDRSIDVHISSLRQKLGDNPRTPRYLQTIRSVGYMMAKF